VAVAAAVHHQVEVEAQAAAEEDKYINIIAGLLVLLLYNHKFLILNR
jgi:hypothetical protein